MNEKINALKKALRRLSPIQGEVARRNARRAVSAACASIKRAVDIEYPAPPRKVKKTSRDPVVVANRQRAKGLVVAGWTSEDYVKAGIKIKNIAGSLWVPAWTVQISNQKEWKRAARDLRYRKILLAQKALSAGGINS